MLAKKIKGLTKTLYKKGLISTQNIEEPMRFFATNTNKVAKFHNKYAGKRCFILGNGPSLNKHDFELLKKEYTFGVNSIFYMEEKNGFKPTFYVVEDGHVIDDNVQQIKGFKPEFKFLPSNKKFKFWNNKESIFLNMNRGFYESLSPNFETPRFSMRPDKTVYCAQSVTLINIQLALYFGFSEVYLIGMDFSYKVPESAIVDGKDILSQEDGINHFDPRYFGKGKKWHDPKLHNALEAYRFFKQVYERYNVKIKNASYGGKLDVFDRCDFDSLF